MAQVDPVPGHRGEGQAQGAQGLAGKGPGRRLPVVNVQRPRLPQGIELRGAHRQDHLGGALDEDEAARGGIDQDHHVLGGGIEGDLLQTAGALVGDPGLGGTDQQGEFGRIADATALVAEVGVVADAADLQQAAQTGAVGGVLAHPGLEEMPADVVADATHLQVLPAHPDLGHRHAVFGEGTGLVRADHRGRAQGLRGGQLADQGLAGGHQGPRDREDGGHQGRKHLRDGRHHQGHRPQEAITQVVAQIDPVEEIEGTHDQDRLDEGLDEFAHLALQRGQAGVGALDQSRDLAEDRVPADSDHQAAGGALGQVGPGKAHVALIAGHQVLAGQGLNRLGYRHGFTGQGRLVDMEAAGVDEAQVSGNLIAPLQHQDVARHQFAGRQAPHLAVADHHALGHHHALQGLQGRLGLALLHETQDGVEQDHAEDDQGVREHVAAQDREQGGDGGGDQQNDHHGIVELAQKTHPGRRLAEGNLVPAVTGATLLDLRRGQAPVTGTGQGGEDLIDIGAIPGLGHVGLLTVQRYLRGQNSALAIQDRVKREPPASRRKLKLFVI